MRATTPGAHPAIRRAWLASVALAAIAVLLFFGRAGRSAVLVLAVAAVLFVAAYAAYLVRHTLFLREVGRAEAAYRKGDLERARTILAPLLDRYAGIAPVQRASGLVLYALGDPLSAASLLERAARSYSDDPEVATALVAAYAALNRGGDARRASALMPKHVDVRLALVWSELVALAGDRAAGASIAAELRDRTDVRRSAPRSAMAAALAAIASARTGDAAAADAALSELDPLIGPLPAFDAAFVGYLRGIALRELGRTSAATAAFDRAMAAAPGTIGEALARRERANLAARLAAPSTG